MDLNKPAWSFFIFFILDSWEIQNAIHSKDRKMFAFARFERPRDKRRLICVHDSRVEEIIVSH